MHTFLGWHNKTKIYCCRRKCSRQEEMFMPRNLLSYNTRIIKQIWPDMDFIVLKHTLPNLLLNALIERVGQF